LLLLMIYCLQRAMSAEFAFHPGRYQESVDGIADLLGTINLSCKNRYGILPTRAQSNLRQHK
jgi:hypothetical protein